MNAYDRLLRLGENAARLTQTLFSLPLPETAASVEADDPILRLAALLDTLGSPGVETEAAEVPANNTAYPAVPLPDERVQFPPRRVTSAAHSRPAASRRTSTARSPSVVFTAPNGNFLNTLRVLNLDASDMPPGDVVQYAAPAFPTVIDFSDHQSNVVAARRASPDLPAAPESAKPDYAAGRFTNHPYENGRDIINRVPKFDGVLPDQAPPQGMRLTRGVSRLESLLRANLADSASDPVPAPQSVSEESARRASPLQKLLAAEDHYDADRPETTAPNEPALFYAPEKVVVSENAPPIRAQPEDVSAVDIQRLLDQIADQLEFDLIRTYGTSRNL